MTSFMAFRRRRAAISKDLDLRRPPPAWVEPALSSANEPEEHAGNVLRVRRAVGFGILIWSAFGIYDWYRPPSALACPPARVLMVRAAMCLLLLVVYWRLRRSPLASARELRLLDCLASPINAGALGWIEACVGIASPYDHGVYIVLMSRGAFMIQPWWESWGPNLAVVLTHLVALVVAAWLFPAFAALLGSSAGLFQLAGNHAVMLFAGLVMVMASHSAWEFRRRVFQARQLGQYKLEAPIGEGGHGQVWRAQHTALNLSVAVKILKGDWTPGSPEVRRFHREACATFALKHPNTVRMLDYGVTLDGVCYIAMELLEGFTLAQVVAREGPLDQARALHVVTQVADALAEAHAIGIVHRDVKPDNLVLTRVGEDADFCKLVDFGIAQVSDQAAPALTRTGRVVGTPGYIAPEVLGGASAEPHADVYALGAVLHFALTGQAPRLNGSNALANRQFEESSEATHRGGSPINKELKCVLERCLATAPAGRFANAGVLADHLRQCGAAATGPAGTFSLPRTELTREAHFVPTSPLEQLN